MLKDKNLKKEYTKLNTSQITEGIALCYENAENYLQEANVLYNIKHFSRAASLSILGLEEIGKIEVITSPLITKDKDSEYWEKFWKKFRSHEQKQARAAYVLLRSAYEEKGEEGLNEITGLLIVKTPTRTGMYLNLFKQNGFYVGFDIDNAKFRSPNYITCESARILIDALKNCIKRYEIIKGSGYRDIISMLKRINQDDTHLKELCKSDDEFKKAVKKYVKEHKS